jgi:hypothetical protein
MSELPYRQEHCWSNLPKVVRPGEKELLAEIIDLSPRLISLHVRCQIQLRPEFVISPKRINKICVWLEITGLWYSANYLPADI